MANDQRRTIRGLAPRPLPSPPQPRMTQMNAVQRQAKSPANAAPPHINQHSAHLQRTAQAKMAQVRAVNKPAPPQSPLTTLKVPVVQRHVVHKPAVQAKFKNSIQAARPSSVVQRACILDGLAACWRGIFGGSRQENYQQIQDDRRDVEINVPVRVQPIRRIELVDETVTTLNLPYGITVTGGLITGCALVIYCHDEDFDCYHPSGGVFKSNSKIRRNPNRIFYVYKAVKGDSTQTIESYQRYAQQFRNDCGGNPPLTVYGQLECRADIMVDVNSDSNIQPNGGRWRT